MGMKAALGLGAWWCLAPSERTALADNATWPSVQTAPQVQGDASKDAALIIGIEDYAFVPKVEGAAANARDWFTFLVEGQKMPISRAHLLRNRDGTREQILDIAKRVAGEVEPGGKLWIVFVGHGAPSADGKDGILVGVDAQQTASGLYARSIAQHELLDAVSSGMQSNTVLVIDACFSGRTGSGAPLAPGLQPLIRVKESAPPKAGRSATTILSAGHADQFAGPLPGVNRPAFSYLVLGALRGWGDKTGKGTITAEDAADYAKLALAVVPIGRVQTPEITSPNAKIELSHGAREKGPELSKIVSGDQTPPPQRLVDPNASHAAGAGNGHLRVKATCGTDPHILAGAQKLTVEDILDTHDIDVRPTSDMTASLKYDEATRTRIMKDPDFVDYDLAPGPHRIRVRAKRCAAIEQSIVIEPGAILEYAPSLQPEVIPLVDINFPRPSFAAPGDKFELRGVDGKPICTDFPCTAKVPIKYNDFGIAWKKDDGGGLVLATLPDPGTNATPATNGRLEKTRSTGNLGPALILSGGVIALGAFVMLEAAGGSSQCVYTGAYGTGAGSTPTTITNSGHCGSGPEDSGSFVVTKKDESLTGFGYFWAGLTGVGVATAITGVVFTIMKVGGKDSINVVYSNSAKSVTVRPGANGLIGTF